MFTALLSFELRRRVKMVSTWVYALVLAAGGMLMMLAAGGAFKNVSAASGSERVLANSPHMLFSATAALALFGLLTVAAVFGQAAYQDFGHGTWMIIFTKNVKKAPYLLGRFLGAYIFSAGLMLAIGVGLAFGSAIVYVLDPTQLTEHSTLAYLWPYLLGVWPTLFFAGALFFSLAALTRRMAPVYVGMVVLVLGYTVASAALADIQNQELSALLDPFGLLAFDVMTRYWTPVERNEALLPLTGLMLGNRLLWLAVGAALLGLSIARFRTSVEEHTGKRAPPAEEERQGTTVALPSSEATPMAGAWVRTAASSAWLHFRDVLRSPVYWAFAVAGLFFVTLGQLITKEIYGTPTYPVTWQVLDTSSGSFRLFVIITLTFYAGELVWKERDGGMSDIIDATRVPTWVGYASKLGALVLVALSLKVLVALSALVAQVGRGFFDIEWRLYFTELIVLDLLQDVLLCVLALFAQVLIHQKYLAYGAMVLHYVAWPVLGLLGVEERLVRYGAEPQVPYSDMNGYGHLLQAVFWYRLYWYGLAALLVALGYLLVVRGRETHWRARLAEARARRTGAWTASAAAALLVFIGAGAFIYYHTHVRNPYVTAKDQERQQARYEKEYKSFAALPHPRIIAAEVTFHIYPEARRMEALGTYRVRNKTDAPISRVLMSLSTEANIRKLSLAGVELPSSHDRELGVAVFELPTPLAPGAEADLVYDFEFTPPSLAHQTYTSIVENGTFFNNNLLPLLGYQERIELVQDRDRKEYGLEPKERMADRDDLQARQNNYIRQDSDFVTFEATVSTSPDQIAIAPGYLEKEWMENGRRFFHYRMDQPILNFFSVLSARYAVKRDRWRDVNLEIYYHPTHTYNLDRMMQGMKDSLEYFTEAFGPYQHRQARILEFPRYARFAQSFPNTIPYSESIGFIARVREDEPDDVDYPYYVTAHEIAHQWYAHQVVGGNVQGATMTSETLSQYSALMVMKKRFGPERMRRFLKFELDRYLMGRALERKKEVPLSRVENQPYIHYQKGSLAMYALQDLIGEEKVNRALKRYVDQVRFQGPPYTNSTELLGFLREETPDEYQYLIEDLFETITLYDNRVVAATVKQNPDGGWDVTLKVLAKKYRSDDQGTQTELTFSDWMDIGALDAKGAALYLEKRKVPQGESEYRFTVPEKPAQVGVDPLNKLIDRTSNDNVKAPSEA